MNKFFLSLSLCLLAVISFSCDDKVLDEEFPYTSIKDGGHFLRGNTLRFYFIDGNAHGLINPEDLSTLPISCDTETQPTAMPAAPGDYRAGHYNRNYNSVFYDEYEKMHYCQTSAYGDSRRQSYTFYMAYKGTFDKMEIAYRYTDKNVIGGNYSAKIVSWKVNGVDVYSDDDGFDKKVFIKKVDGKTIVSLKK